MLRKHFVTFFSPGTLFAECTEKPIDSWDVDEAVKMSKKISERYGARPYGFQFSTRERGVDDLDSKVVKRSGTYFLGGTVKTLKEVIAENDPKNEILISNMKCNNWNKIIVNCNSYKCTQPLEKDDVVLKI